MSSRLTNIKTNVISHTFIIIQHIYNICANCLGIDVKVTFVSFIYLVSLFYISTAFLFFFFYSRSSRKQPPRTFEKKLVACENELS